MWGKFFLASLQLGDRWSASTNLLVEQQNDWWHLLTRLPGDSIVMDFLMEKFGAEVNAFDIKLFFVIQTYYIEAVHAETYTNLLTTIVKDETKED